MSKFADYIINTNNKYRAQDEIEMLEKQRFGAFCDHSKTIDRINGGDTVFLYKSGQGIIAYGQATGVVDVEDRIKPENGELVINGSHYQNLNGFTKIHKPLPASEIKVLLERGMSFLNPIFKLKNNEGERIIAYLKQST